MTPHRSLRALAVMVVALTLWPATALAQSDDAESRPPGNNGTVKIDGDPWDVHPNNEPHPGCVFEIDFYGYDEGEDLFADYSLDLIAPTKGGEAASGRTFIGEDDAGGGRDHDATVRLELRDALEDSGIEPHPQQGWHLKLTVNADGSIGSDVKHKVLWVTCPAAAEVLGARAERVERDDTDVLGGRLARTGPLSAPLAIAGMAWLAAGLAARRAARRRAW